MLCWERVGEIQLSAVTNSHKSSALDQNTEYYQAAWTCGRAMLQSEASNHALEICTQKVAVDGDAFHSGCKSTKTAAAAQFTSLVQLRETQCRNKTSRVVSRVV